MSIEDRYSSSTRGNTPITVEELSVAVPLGASISSNHLSSALRRSLDFEEIGVDGAVQYSSGR